MSHKDLCSGQLPGHWLFNLTILLVLCYLTILSLALDLHKTSASHQPAGLGTSCTLSQESVPSSSLNLTWETPTPLGPQLKGLSQQSSVSVLYFFEHTLICVSI